MRKKKKIKQMLHSVAKLEDLSISQRNAIQVDQVSKVFLQQRKIFSRSFFTFHSQRLSFKAINNVTFSVRKGECIGIIGLNGSGKSTLSSLIAGHLAPSNGVIKRGGTVSLLAISTGLKANLTGLENIELKLLLLGFKPQEIKERIQKIVDFTELSDFLKQPLKQYSSGMRAKLGFGIAIQTDPDILIIDEALSVGDQTFYRKCLTAIDHFKQSGKTIIFISHAISQIRETCDRVIWMHYGKLQMFDESKAVCLEYSKFVHHFNKKTKLERQVYQQERVAKQFCYVKKKIVNQESGITWSFIVYTIVLGCLMVFCAWQMIKG